MTDKLIDWLEKHKLLVTCNWVILGLLFACVWFFLSKHADEKIALDARLEAIEQKLETVPSSEKHL